MKTERRVVVVSVDAMVFEDTELLRTLPAVAEIWDRCARVERVRSIYPSVTYPCHTTMSTGVYPQRHGLVSNDHVIPGKSKTPWFFFRDQVRAKTLPDYVKQAGMTTGSVFWPVTGRDASIDYLIDEYWPQHAAQGDLDCFRESGSSEAVIERIVRPNIRLLSGRHRQHPYCDAFIYACAGDMLREFKPNLLMLHPANLDAYRHQTGLFTPLVTHGIHETDGWLRMLFKAAQDAGVFEDTDFFIVSDHGQLNVHRAVALNALLAGRGLLPLDADGNGRDWQAWAHSNGLSALVFVRDGAEQALHAVLKALVEEGAWGIESVITREEAARTYHLDGGFAFVLESDGITTFSGGLDAPVMRTLNNSDYRLGRATHGHLPDKGPQPTLLAFGPHIRAGAVLPQAHLVDEAPTFAAALGLQMQDVQGRVLHELLR